MSAEKKAPRLCLRCEISANVSLKDERGINTPYHQREYKEVDPTSENLILVEILIRRKQGTPYYIFPDEGRYLITPIKRILHKDGKTATAYWRQSVCHYDRHVGLMPIFVRYVKVTGYVL